MKLGYVFLAGILAFAPVSYGNAMDQNPFDQFVVQVSDDDGKPRTFKFNLFDGWDSVTDEEWLAYDQIFDFENFYLTFGDEELARKNLEARQKRTREQRIQAAKKRHELEDQHLQENNADLDKGKGWLVWEIKSDQSKEIFAQLGIAPCVDAGLVDDRFKEVELVEFGLNLAKNYRNKRLEARVMHAFLKYLSGTSLYKDASFGTRTLMVDSNTVTMAADLGYVAQPKEIPWTVKLDNGESLTKHYVLFVEKKLSDELQVIQKVDKTT